MLHEFQKSFLTIGYCSVLLVAIITAAELIITYKRPLILKSLLLVLNLCLIGRVTGMFLLLSTNKYFYVISICSAVAGTVLLYLITYINQSKISKRMFFWGLFIISIPLFIVVVFLKKFIQYPDNLALYIRYSVSTIIVLSLSVYIFKINKKFKSANLYFKKACLWFNTLIILLVWYAIINLIKISLPAFSFYWNVCLLAGDLSLVLLILFRPKFLNNSVPAISNWQAIADKKAHTINSAFFINEFFSKLYYLEPDASADGFSLILNTTRGYLENFVFDNYNLTFNELVNKSRVDYFKNLVMNGGYKKYTVEGLSTMAGFKNRQSLYNAYKKFSEGTPSDMVSIVGK